MVIAAHIDSVYLPASQLFQSLKFLAQQNPADRFFIFADHDVPEKDGLHNIEFIDIKPALKSNLRLHFWYNYKLPGLLKKIKADVFLSDAGICSLKATMPQWSVLINTTFLHKNAVIQFKTDAYKRKYFPKISKAATGFLVRQEYMAGQVAGKYPVAKEKFHWIGEYFFDLYHPMPWEAKTGLLENLTGGIEYFLCVGMPATRANITTILKAFSLFKKRLKSSLRLVLALQDVSLEQCVKDFRLYKYRDDVIVINEYQQHSYPQLLAAAYAVIYMPSEITGYSERGLPAMQSGTPVITINKPEHHSLYKDAALFSDTDDKSIADNMMLLYKDEALRKDYIQKGLELTKECTLPAMANRLWQTISVRDFK